MTFTSTEYVHITTKELKKIIKQVEAAFKEENKPLNSPFYMVIENGNFTHVTDELPKRKS